MKLSNPTPGCCGPMEDRMKMVQEVSRALHTGHKGLAAIYRTIAAEADKKDKKKFTDVADRHDKMAEASLQLVVPDGVELPE